MTCNFLIFEYNFKILDEIFRSIVEKDKIKYGIENTLEKLYNEIPICNIFYLVNFFIFKYKLYYMCEVISFMEYSFYKSKNSEPMIFLKHLIHYLSIQCVV